jgi:ribosome biogenesis GTPase
MREMDPFLIVLGWNDFFQAGLVASHDVVKLEPGRVIGQGRGHYTVQTSAEEILEAAITTKLHDDISDAAGFPTVGDWVMFNCRDGSEQATIHRVLQRKSLIQRRRSGAQQEMQLIAANADFLLVVHSLSEDFNLERLGRFIALGNEPGCTTAVVLTKADLCANASEYVDKVKGEFKDIEVFAISESDLQSLAALEKFFSPGKTSVLLGSSGVGKSTLTNYLLGFESQKTQSLGSNSRGRHTTTARHLRVTRFGGLVMDTPGMQDISAGPQKDFAKDFSDLEETMLGCKFTNCQHKSEPGCAILELIRTGHLSSERWAKYLAAKAVSQRREKKRSR